LGWRYVGVPGRFLAISSVSAVYAAVSAQLPANPFDAAVHHSANIGMLPGQSRNFCALHNIFLLHRIYSSPRIRGAVAIVSFTHNQEEKGCRPRGA